MTPIEIKKRTQAPLVVFQGFLSVDIVLTIFCLLLATACGRGGPDCSETLPIEGSYVQLTFLNRNGENLYSQDNPFPAFNIDSLYVSNSNGRNFFQQKAVMPGPFATKYYVYAFGGIYDPAIDADALIKERCENYYIHYSYSDVDTLTFCYQVGDGGCGLRYSPFKAYYRNQLIFEKQAGVLFTIDITK